MICCQCGNKIKPGEDALTVAPNQVLCEGCQDAELDIAPWSGPDDSKPASKDLQQ